MQAHNEYNLLDAARVLPYLDRFAVSLPMGPLNCYEACSLNWGSFTWILRGIGDGSTKRQLLVHQWLLSSD